MLIVDAHLDLADNALRGRAVERPAREQKPDEAGTPTVGLPDLRAGGVRLVCATIFCQPAIDGEEGYRTQDEAHTRAVQQLDWYHRQQDAGTMQFIRTSGDLKWLEDAKKTHAILLLEGADPIRHDSDAQRFASDGIRIVGLAWKRTRYAGGTRAPGPLTDDGVSLVRTLDQLKIIHDTSHLAEESFWQLLEISGGPVIASHSNCRSIVPTDRQLSDEMIRAIARRDGIIGINFYDKFLLSPDEYGKRRAKLSDVVHHIRHICDLAGDAKHVGLGTDMDGYVPREHIPVEIETSADLPRVADALAAANFSDGDVAGMMGENWVKFFERNLPGK